MIVSALVHHRAEPSQRKLAYAMLDNQSNACFVSQSLVDDIKAPSAPVNLRLTTVVSESVIKSSIVHDLVVSDIKGETEISLPDTYSRFDIPGDRNLIPNPETVRKWPHLRHVAQ